MGPRAAKDPPPCAAPARTRRSRRKGRAARDMQQPASPRSELQRAQPAANPSREVLNGLPGGECRRMDPPSRAAWRLMAPAARRRSARVHAPAREARVLGARGQSKKTCRSICSDSFFYSDGGAAHGATAAEAPSVELAPPVVTWSNSQRGNGIVRRDPAAGRRSRAPARAPSPKARGAGAAPQRDPGPAGRSDRRRPPTSTCRPCRRPGASAGSSSSPGSRPRGRRWSAAGTRSRPRSAAPCA